MKSIKTTFIRGLSLLLALVIVLNLPISAFAATEDGIEAYAYSYDAVRTEIMAHPAFAALKYLGYDRNEYLENAGYLFTSGYYGGSLNRKIEAGTIPDCLTDIGYSGVGSGMQTSTKSTGYTDVVSVTGKYPDVSYFESGENKSLDCVDYVTYYLTNYLPNIEGANISVIQEAMALLQSQGRNFNNRYDNMYFWDEARDYFKSEGVSVYEVTEADGNSGEITEYIDPDGVTRTDDIYNHLSIGSLIQMGEIEDLNGDGKVNPLIHYAIYAGTYNGTHFIYHCGNSRGPEISRVEAMAADNNSSDKTSVALYFYDLTTFITEEDYGSITIYKDDPDGNPLSGAKFLVSNLDTGEVLEVTTGSDGYARLEDLLLGTYSITEAAAPSGYVKVDTVWTVTLTKEKPDGGGTIRVTNRKDAGSLKIIKNVLPSMIATPSNLAGWQFTVHSNYSYYLPALNATTNGNSYRVKIYDKFGNMVESNTVTISYSPITAHPQDVFLALDANGTMSVTTNGTGYTYVWQYSEDNGGTWRNTSATGSTVGVQMKAFRHLWLYRCQVTDANGNVYHSEPARMYYDTDLAITQQPKDTTISIGKTASFTVKAHGSNLSYMWYVSDDGGTTWTQLNAGTVNGNTSTYTSPTATANTKYHRMFKCVVSDGTSSVETKIASCYRADGYDADGSYKGITIVENLANTTGLLNSRPRIGTVISGDGICYEWEMYDQTTGTWSMLNAARWTATTGSDGTAQLDDIMSGTYFVREVNTGKNGWMYDSIPRAVTITADNTTVLPVTASFINKAYGSLKIIKDILPDTAAVPDNLAGWQFTVHVNNPYLTLDPATESGQYRVKVTDKDGNTVISDAATVGYSPIVEHPKDVFLALYASGTMSVTTVGTGYTYVWQYSENNGATWKDTTATASTVGVGMQAFRHLWLYRCKVTDADGNVYYSKPATMYYNTDLVITEQPKNTLIAIGKKASFSVEAHGSNLSYMWYVSDDGGTTWSQLNAGTINSNTSTFTSSIANANTKHHRLFKCIVSDGTNSMESDVVSWYRADGYDADGSYQGVEIANQPQGTFAPSVTLNVAASGDNLIYEWERYNEETDTWELVNTAVNDTVYTTDQNGTIQIDNLPADNYFVREVNDGRPGWEYDTEAKLITVTPDNTSTLPVEVVFTNTIIKSGFKIQKTTEDGENLEGWLFNVYADEACTILVAENEKTNENGIIAISDLAYGTYWVKEIGHEDPEIDDLYVCDSENPQPVEVYANSNDAVEFFNKLKYGSLEVQKTVNVDGYLGGWQFDVYVGSVDPDNLLAGSPFTTDDKGYYLIEKLLPGKYIVVEQGIESEYWVCDTEEHEVNVEAGKQPAYVELENTVYSKLQIKKVTTDGSSPVGYKFNVRYYNGVLVEGSPFTVEREDGIIEIPGLFLPGLYHVSEVLDDDDPYEVIDGQNKTMTVKPETTATFTFTNAPKVGDLTIQKNTNTDLNKNGWFFNVYRGGVSDENLLDGSPFEITDENGVLTIKGLPIDTYIVVEVNDNKDFWIYDLEEKTVTVPHNDIGTAVFENTQYGYLQIKKVTTDGSSPLGYQFNVYAPDGSLLDGSPFVVENEDGTITGIQIFGAGEYRIEEILPDDSKYEVDGDNPVYFTAELGKVNDFVVISNKPKTGSLKITKQTNTGNNKNGWFFNVYRDSIAAENLVNEQPLEIIDESGVLIVENLPIGTYIVVEVNDGRDLWVYDVKEKTVAVPHNGVGEADPFVNTHMGRAQIKKKTTGGGTAAGWQFKIMTADGASIGTFTTDAKGEITETFAPGVYYVTELGHVSEDMDFWICDPEPTKQITVVAGDTRTVEFLNDWYGGGIIHKEMADGSSPIGFRFEVTDINGVEIPGSPFEVKNADGTIDIGLLAPGQYIVKEIIPESSLYQPVGSNPKTLVIEGGKTNTVDFINALPSASISVEKVNHEGKHLAGAKFLLEWSDDDGATWTPVTYHNGAEVTPGGCSSADLTDGCLTTDASGIAMFDGLHPDMTYRLTEVQAPNEYMLQTAPVYEGKLPTPDFKATIKVVNYPVIDMPSTGAGNTPHTMALTAFVIVLTTLVILGYVVVRPLVFTNPNSPRD